MTNIINNISNSMKLLKQWENKRLKIVDIKKSLNISYNLLVSNSPFSSDLISILEYKIKEINKDLNIYSEINNDFFNLLKINKHNLPDKQTTKIINDIHNKYFI